jgi:hypothetical protein
MLLATGVRSKRELDLVITRLKLALDALVGLLYSLITWLPIGNN